MSFASSPSSESTSKHDVIAIVQSNSYCNLGPDSEQPKAISTRHALHAEQDDTPPRALPSLQPSFQADYEITDTNLSLGSPSSWSTTTTPNVGHHPNRSLNDIKTGEPYPSPTPSSPESPPLTDNIFPNSVTTTSKYEIKKRFNPSIILKNCGSVARDHLASERTFIAYVHTSLALSGAGVAMVQLLTIGDFISLSAKDSEILEKGMKRFALPLGVVTQVLALIILFLGVYRYFVVQYALPKNMFPVARLSIAVLSFVLGVLVVVIFWAIWID